MFMVLCKEQLAGMIDISAVKADSNCNEVDAIVEAAVKHKFIAVFTLPSFSRYAKTLLGEKSGIRLGGTVGFPSGSSTISTKAFEANELLQIGCDELDMVINIGKLKSGLFQDVTEEIKNIVAIAQKVPVKVILEVSLLNDHEIDVGSKIICDSGAQFIKTGTGWSGATTLEHIAAIKKSVGESINIKVAGGVRELDVLLKIHEMGVSRFGLGYKAAIDIIEEYSKTQEARNELSNLSL
jgi:deoxyribose-phosphate aldolase